MSLLYMKGHLREVLVVPRRRSHQFSLLNDVLITLDRCKPHSRKHVPAQLLLDARGDIWNIGGWHGRNETQ